MLQWLMDAVRDQPPEEQTNRGLATRVLLVGFAAIHTSSMVSIGPENEGHKLTIELFAELYACTLLSGRQSRVHEAYA